MHQSQPQVNTLLLIVAVLAVVGGLAIVIVTSPQSWQYGPATWIQAMLTTPTKVLPTATEPTATPSPVPTQPTATPTAQSTVLVFTATPTVLISPTPTLTPTDTPIPVPPDVLALGTVTTQGTNTARVRNQPGGDTVVAALANGTQVQVLGGKIQFQGVTWLQIRLPNGQVGWIADFLVHITQTFS